LAATRTGDHNAFCEICDHLTEYLLLTASSQLGGGLSAKLGASDVVQQTLLEAQQEFTSFRGSSENEFRAWLVRLVQRNLVGSPQFFGNSQKHNLMRKVALGMGSLGETLPRSQKTTCNIARQFETDDQLLRAVAQLPARRRRMIDLRHWQGLSFSEIGKELEISEATARNLWLLAVDELRKKLDSGHSFHPPHPR